MDRCVYVGLRLTFFVARVEQGHWLFYKVFDLFLIRIIYNTS